ncbi:hypothetical protein BDB01DRAFT_778819 [Pilobolus umbonatus]|nr:hypothetical protein BDB01DRAFT_778819 [Pilobolus umbonatus]
MIKSWITIFDVALAGRVSFISDSILDATGWHPEELIGKSAYDFTHPEDFANLTKIHQIYVTKQVMSTLVSCRFKTKNDGYIRVESVIHYSYDHLVASTYILDRHSLDHKLRLNTVDEIFDCLPGGSLQRVGTWQISQDMRRNNLHDQYNSGTISDEHEKRCHLILNRFSDLFYIVYASKYAKDMVGDHITKGASVFDLIHPDDSNSIRVQLNLAKKHNIVVKLRFRPMKEMYPSLDGIVSSSNDGLLLVLRPLHMTLMR